LPKNASDFDIIWKIFILISFKSPPLKHRHLSLPATATENTNSNKNKKKRGESGDQNRVSETPSTAGASGQQRAFVSNALPVSPRALEERCRVNAHS